MLRLLLLVVLQTCLLRGGVLAASWKTVTPAGSYISREETTLVACGGSNLCLLGGRGKTKTPVIDTATLKWSNGAAPPKQVHHFQGVQGPDGCAWVFGAWTEGFPAESVVPEIYRYCSVEDKWEVVGQMARPRGSAGAVYYEGYFYVVTGNVGGHQASANTVNWFDRYDPKTKQWSTLAPVPHPRDHAYAAVLAGKLYVIGGRDSGGADFPKFFELTEQHVDVYSFSSNSWSTLPEGIPSPRAGAPAVVHQGKIYIAGGEGDGKAYKRVDILNGSSFQSGPPMLHPRHGFGLYACNGVIWAAGGAGIQGGGSAQTMLDAYFDGDKPNPCTTSTNSDESNNTDESEDEKDQSEGKSPETPQIAKPPVESEPSRSASPSPSTSAKPSQKPVTPSPTMSPKPLTQPVQSNSSTIKQSSQPIPTMVPVKNSTNSNNSEDAVEPTTTPLPVKNATSTRDSATISEPTTTLEPEETTEDVENSTTSEDSDSQDTSDGSDSSGGLGAENSTDIDEESGASAGSDSDSDTDSDSTGDSDANEPSGNTTARACFPAHATVRLDDGTVRTMESLRIGDKVLVAHPNDYSEVYFFSHQHREHVSNFVSIRTADDEHNLQLSERHVLYVNGELVEARHIRVGDKVSIAHEKKFAVVSSVARITAKGLYNPHTLHGDIVVNDIAASTLTRSVHPHIARALLRPFAALYQFIGPHPVTATVNDYVLRALARFVW